MCRRFIHNQEKTARSPFSVEAGSAPPPCWASVLVLFSLRFSFLPLGQFRFPLIVGSVITVTLVAFFVCIVILTGPVYSGRPRFDRPMLRWNLLNRIGALVLVGLTTTVWGYLVTRLFQETVLKG